MIRAFASMIFILLASQARAQTAITAFGVISASGSYHLTNSLISSSCESPLVLAAPSIKLNLNGFEIKCVNPVQSGASPIGVLLADDADYAEVYGGFITGWQYGVYATKDAYAPFIHNLNVSANTNIGVLVGGDYARIHNVAAANIGGRSDEAYAVCIQISGDNSQIMWSACLNTYRQAHAPPEMVGEGVAFLVSSGANNAYLQYNTAQNKEIQPNTIAAWVSTGTGHSLGFMQSRNFMTGIQGAGRGSFSRNAILLSAPTAGSVGVSLAEPDDATDNLIVNYKTAGVDPGTNTIVD